MFNLDLIDRKYNLFGENCFHVKDAYCMRNLICNEYDSHFEVIYRKEPFYCRKKSIELDKHSKHSVGRNWFFNGSNLAPVNSNVSLDDLLASIKKSRKRARDNIYGYLLSNRWRFFVTLTFDPKKVDRDDVSSIKYAYKLFRQKVQYLFKNVKIFAIPEAHPTSGKLHIHALISDIDLKRFLISAKYPDIEKFRKKGIVGNSIKSSFGDEVFNLSLFDFGFSTVIDLGDSYNNIRIANYLAKYVSKNISIDYNCKSYFCTHNLKFRNKFLSFIDDNVFFELIKEYNIDDNGECVFDNEYTIEKVKETDSMYVYNFIKNKIKLE